MNLTEFYNEVARQADTDTQKIGASETKRVLAVAFSILATHDAATVMELIAKGLTVAKKKQK
jgi:hypothetical protein